MTSYLKPQNATSNTLISQSRACRNVDGAQVPAAWMELASHQQAQGKHRHKGDATAMCKHLFLSIQTYPFISHKPNSLSPQILECIFVKSTRYWACTQNAHTLKMYTHTKAQPIKHRQTAELGALAASQVPQWRSTVRLLPTRNSVVFPLRGPDGSDLGLAMWECKVEGTGPIPTETPDSHSQCTGLPAVMGSCPRWYCPRPPSPLRETIASLSGPAAAPLLFSWSFHAHWRC